MLNDHIKSLQKHIKPGVKRLNWSSLGIQDYIAKCEEALSKFESLSNQVLKNASDIEERLRTIETACLVKNPFEETGPDGKLLEAKVLKNYCPVSIHPYCITIVFDLCVLYTYVRTYVLMSFYNYLYVHIHGIYLCVYDIHTYVYIYVCRLSYCICNHMYCICVGSG